MAFNFRAARFAKRVPRRSIGGATGDGADASCCSSGRTAFGFQDRSAKDGHSIASVCSGRSAAEEGGRERAQGWLLRKQSGPAASRAGSHWIDSERAHLTCSVSEVQLHPSLLRVRGQAVGFSQELHRGRSVSEVQYAPGVPGTITAVVACTWRGTWPRPSKDSCRNAHRLRQCPREQSMLRGCA